MSATDDAQSRTLRVHQQVASGWLLAAVVGFLGLVGYLYTQIQISTADIAKSNTAVQVHLSQIDERIAVLQTQIAQTYRADDARRDTAEWTRQMDDVKRRLSTLEANMGSRTQPSALQQWRKN